MCILHHTQSTMCTNDCVKRLLVNMKVIAQLKEHDKLCTQGQTFHVYPPSKTQFVSRWWASENRNNTICEIEKNVVCATDLVQRIMTSEMLCIKIRHKQLSDEEVNFLRASEMFTTDERRTDSLHMDNVTFLNYLKTEMTNCCSGLESLKSTYSEDSHTTAKIDILLQSFQRQIGNIVNFLEKQTNFQDSNG